MRSGALPKGEYGALALGASMKECRGPRSLLASARCRAQMRCPVIVVAASYGSFADPVVKRLSAQLKHVRNHLKRTPRTLA